MSWIASLDTRADHWPTPAKWAYRGLKWYLVGLGAILVLRLWTDRIGIWPLY